MACYIIRNMEKILRDSLYFHLMKIYKSNQPLQQLMYKHFLELSFLFHFCYGFFKTNLYLIKYMQIKNRVKMIEGLSVNFVFSVNKLLGFKRTNCWVKRDYYQYKIRQNFNDFFLENHEFRLISVIFQIQKVYLSTYLQKKKMKTKNILMIFLNFYYLFSFLCWILLLWIKCKN